MILVKNSIILGVVLFMIGTGLYINQLAKPLQQRMMMSGINGTSLITKVPNIINDAQEIKALLVNKNNWYAENIILKIKTNDGVYASGNIEDKTVGGGGLWFAKRIEGIWQIVFDGNGNIMCSSLKDFPDYPVKLIPECWDDKTGKIIKRPMLPGGDRDEHGCIGSAGYSWCQPKQKCLRVWEEKCE